MYRHDPKRMRSWFFSCVLVMVAGVANAQTTWYVDDDNCPGPGSGTVGDPFCAIQSGIIVATPGDTVLVQPGTYGEAIDLMGKAIEVRSANGPSVTTIDATGLYTSVVTSASGEGPDTVLEGFTVTGGMGSLSYLYGLFCGGGMYIAYSSPTVIDCVFTANSADFGGGMCTEDSYSVILGCLFDDNAAVYGGGGIASAIGHIAAINCVFSGNAAYSYDFMFGGGGGGMYVDFGGLVTVTNCTFSLNNAVWPAEGGAVLVRQAGFAGITNSILCNDSFPEIGVDFSNPGDAAVWFSDVCDGWWGPGDNNISDDPLFVNPSADDFHLSSGSPCINAGDDYAVPPEVTTDFEGDDRIRQCRVDMGADETPYIGVDCNTNGTADECEDDCNGNGVPDGCDITGPTSDDCNENDVPDECDITGVTSEDCNGDQRPDECEIDENSTAPGGPFFCTADCDPDCNDNGVPDECDIAGATSDDCNENQVSDECEMLVYLYVDADAPPGGDGVSWNTAYDDLQPALATAACASTTEIRVAEGTYLPTTGTDRSATFQLIDGLTLLGGYAGYGQAAPDARDTVLYETILSGDLNGDDGPDFANNDENSYHVVTGNGTAETAVLDGFTVSGGNADGDVGSFNGYGGGILNMAGSPTVANCTFVNNHSNGGASGVDSYQSSSVTLQDSITHDSTIVDAGSALDVSGSALGGDDICVGASAVLQGSGVISGPLRVRGTVRSNSAGETLEITGDHTHASDGVVEAVDGGTLLIRADIGAEVLETGELVADAGLILAGEDVSVDVQTVTIDAGGVYAGDPGATGMNAAALTAQTLTILEGDCDTFISGGQMDLDDTMSVTVSGNLTVQGPSSLSCGGAGSAANDGQALSRQALSPPTCGGSFELGTPAAALGVILPPKLNNCGSSVTTVGGDLKLSGAVLTVNESLDGGITLAGDLDNQSTFPSVFNWSTGGIALNGAGPQVVEVAGLDLGQTLEGFLTDQDTLFDTEQHTNYSMGTIEVAPGASVTLANQFANSAGTGACDEALYVHNLILNDGATLVVDNCKIYYENLTRAETAVIEQIGCGALKCLQPAIHNTTQDTYHCTIQDAINHAYGGGEVIEVSPGTYYEKIDFFNIPVTVRSTHGPEVTIIHGDNSGSVVTCADGEGPGTVLDGFTITGGTGTTFIPDSQLCGGGMFNSHTSPTVVNCIFRGNGAYRGGGIYNYSASPTITNCKFIGNDVGLAGGGIANYGDSHPTVINCMFSGNTAAQSGGGMINRDTSNPLLTNCTFTGNWGWYGGGIDTGNYGTLTNCVFWENNDVDGEPDEAAQIRYAPSAINHSCVQGWTGTLGGTGNFGDDPLLVDADGPDDAYGTDDDNPRLTGDSPCIDAGDDAVVVVTQDLDRNPRIMDGDESGTATVDIGAYEYFSDDCNENGIPDVCDINCAALGGACYRPGCGQSADANGDGIPDSCCMLASQPVADALVKNRYLSVLAGEPGFFQAIRVRADGLPAPFDSWIGQEYFAGTPIQVCENSGQGTNVQPPGCGPAPGPDNPQNWFWASPLLCDSASAHFMDWSALADYCNAPGTTANGAPCTVDAECGTGTCGVDGVIHLYHEMVLPSHMASSTGPIDVPAVYSVQMVDSTCPVGSETSYSPPVEITQAGWGDVVLDVASCPNGPPNESVGVVSDVVGLLNKFSNLDCAPQKVRADIQPNRVDFKIDIADVVRCLGAFIGDEYPFGAGQCVGGYCSGGLDHGSACVDDDDCDWQPCP